MGHWHGDIYRQVVAIQRLSVAKGPGLIVFEQLSTCRGEGGRRRYYNNLVCKKIWTVKYM